MVYDYGHTEWLVSYAMFGLTGTVRAGCTGLRLGLGIFLLSIFFARFAGVLGEWCRGRSTDMDVSVGSIRVSGESEDGVIAWICAAAFVQGALSLWVAWVCRRVYRKARRLQTVIQSGFCHGLTTDGVAGGR